MRAPGSGMVTRMRGQAAVREARNHSRAGDRRDEEGVAGVGAECELEKVFAEGVGAEVEGIDLAEDGLGAGVGVSSTVSPAAWAARRRPAGDRGSQ